MGSSKTRRSSCSFLNLLVSFFNFILFILSAASLAPILALKTPPTSLGYAFLMISSISILSSFIGFYSNLSQFCNITHFSLLLASLTGQLLGILALFTKEKSSLSLMKSPRDPKESKFLVRLECGVLMAMFVVQMGVLILCWAVHKCCVREHHDNSAKIAEVKENEMDEKKIKYGKLMKNDLEA